MSICEDCIETECIHRNDNVTVCSEFNTLVFSYRKYIRTEVNKEILLQSFIDGWPRYCDGATKVDLDRRKIHVPDNCFVSSKDFNQCKPQEAMELLKKRLKELAIKK